MAAPNSAVALPTLSAADITALLRGAGAIDDAGSTFNRMKVDGSMFTAGDQVFPYNPNTGAPAFIGRLIGPPEQYQGFWFGEKAAIFANRAEDANSMCKSYYDEPSQARKFSEHGNSCEACPFQPFHTPPPDMGGKCSWKGDIGLNIVPADGVLTGTEEEWTLTLPTTSMIEFRGTRKAPTAGSVSELNFMHKLALFAQDHAQEWGFNTVEEAVGAALTSFQLGGVAAEFRLLRAQNEDRSRSWNVISLTPVWVNTDFENLQQLGDGTDNGTEPVPEPTEDDIPF